MDPFISPLVDMAQAFDNAQNDDFFFLPPDALKTADFQVGMNFFMTPDGKGARIVMYHTGEAQARKASNRYKVWRPPRKKPSRGRRCRMPRSS